MPTLLAGLDGSLSRPRRSAAFQRLSVGGSAQCARAVLSAANPGVPQLLARADRGLCLGGIAVHARIRLLLLGVARLGQTQRALYHRDDRAAESRERQLRHRSRLERRLSSATLR